MTETDPVGGINPTRQGTPDQAERGTPRTEADTASDDDQVISRITSLPRDVGWMMISVGVLGVVLPGLPGAPFLVAGAAVLAPGGPRLLARWARGRPKGVVHSGLKQISRWLDDLERRYPR